jgi:hypothetical protein
MLTKENIQQGDILELRDKRYQQNRFIGRIFILLITDSFVVSLLPNRKIIYASYSRHSIELFTKIND